MIPFAQSGPFASIFLPIESGKRISFHWNGSLEGCIALPFPHQQTKKQHFATQEEHTSLIRQAIASMVRGDMKKVVLSRQKRVPFTRARNPEDVFSNLLERYPQATVYVFRDGEGHMWMGATPELLLKKRGVNFQTAALAGTQPLVPGRDLGDYRWGQKEKTEQILVVEFIQDVLEKGGAKNILVSPTATVAAGKVVHLQTALTFDSDADVLYWASRLHPTPAVCGTPRDQALAFIHRYEPHDRGYYAGIIGRIDSGGDADLFVNLRCMQWQEDAAILYVGSGITKDSDAEAEWNETELKAQTLLNVLEEKS